MTDTSFNLSPFDGCRLLVVGDLMIDEYVWGEVDRISPEAPVQVVSVKTEEFTLGGSGNVIHNLVSLGAKVAAVGVVGPGTDGRTLAEKLANLGVDTGGVITDPDRATTRKTRIIAAHQHVLRIDRESRLEISQEIMERLARFIEGKMDSVDGVLVSDYGKGVVSSRLMARIVSSAEKHGKGVTVDPKGFDYAKYAGASLITPNTREASLASGIEIVDDQSLAAAGFRLLERVPIERLLITCGKDGMVLFERRQEPYRITAEAKEVYDVSGAGDTVVAVMGIAMACGMPARQAAVLANTAAGIVVGKVGTATVTRKEILLAMDRSCDGYPVKLKGIPELAEIGRDLRRKGKKLVLTNGCFDLLHAGHVVLFSAARQLGDALVVAIDDDESVRRLKGPGRPVIGARERVRILCALDSVDYVVLFSSREDLETLIEAVRPDVLTKGSNYRSEEVLGKSLVEAYGGQVRLIPVTERISATEIINAIKSSGANP
jgi:D-beta-D-heptose 7-phosphate kinase/D-beta-D-heptose 1-phosphate adenosyltransferase